MRAEENSGKAKGGKASTRSGHCAVSAAEIEKYIKGISFPCDKDNLIAQALDNDAPEEVLRMMEEFPEQEYGSPVEVARCVGQLKH